MRCMHRSHVAVSRMWIYDHAIDANFKRPARRRSGFYYWVLLLAVSRAALAASSTKTGAEGFYFLSGCRGGQSLRKTSWEMSCNLLLYRGGQSWLQPTSNLSFIAYMQLLCLMFSEPFLCPLFLQRPWSRSWYITPLWNISYHITSYTLVDVYFYIPYP